MNRTEALQKVTFLKLPAPLANSAWLATLKSALLPLIGLSLFLVLWNITAKNIDTSLGQFPGPVQVYQQSVNLWQEHQAEQLKAEAFYQRQEERNARRVEADPDYQPKIRPYTGAPTFFQQIWTSLYTVAVGFFYRLFDCCTGGHFMWSE